MPKRVRRAICATLLSLPLVVARPSGAQSSNFVRVTGAPGTLTCAAGSVDVAGGTLALEWSVPSSEFDGVAEARVNGNVILSTPIMIPGSSGAVPATLSLTFAPVAFPYTFTVRVIPSIASFPPVGFSFSCPAAGPGTNFRILGVSAGIPALSDTGLLIVSVLLALAGGFALRRRGGRSG